MCIRDSDKKGYLDQADGGTLFLDELGEISLMGQVKLLRAIEHGGFTPVGGAQIHRPDVRIIAATDVYKRQAYRIVRGPRCRIDGIEGLKAEVKENPDTFVYGKGANTADGVPDERFHFFSLREFRLFLKLILKFPVVDPCRTHHHNNNRPFSRLERQRLGDASGFASGCGGRQLDVYKRQGTHRVEIMGHPHAARLVGVAVAEFGQAVRKGHLVRLLDIVEGILSIPEREHFVRIHDFVRVGQMHVHDMESVANQPIKEGYPLQSPYEQAGFLIGSNRTATEDETRWV